MASGKRILVCADGTWNDPHDDTPTNVLRVARAVRPVASDGRAQVVFYDWGVGSYYGELRGGASGLGMLKNIEDGYRFIVQNYEPGDQIALFGFSRGAYTVRSLAGMLNKCGILRREHAGSIPDAFEFYKRADLMPGSPEAEAWRAQWGHAPARGVVDFIGVWDTVGALGIPTRVLAFVEERDLFFDAELGSNVRVARHAVSIDEKRSDFVPTLWSPKESTDLKQVWFAGVHADVGGGYAPDDQGRHLSDIPLAWMAREATRAGIEFEPHLVQPEALAIDAPAHESHRRHWRALGSTARSVPTPARVHHSVRARYDRGLRTPAIEDWLGRHGGLWGELED